MAESQIMPGYVPAPGTTPDAPLTRIMAHGGDQTIALLVCMVIL
jgi:hypothetical protein